MHRRRFLQGVAATGVGAAVLGPRSWVSPRVAAAAASGPFHVATGEVYQPSPHFPEGVLSGDPTADGVVLWTRPAPALDAGSGVDVTVEVATAVDFAPASIVHEDSAAATAARDHCVAFDVDGLDPSTTYWYRFTAAGNTSPVGRTRTAPDPDDDNARARMAFFSCQRWMHGYYSAHRWLAALAADQMADLDLVISLGNYVYNTGPADDFAVPGRVDPILDATTLEEFRAKYHLYRTDLDLQAMHANFPLLAIFDNHDGQSGPWDASGPGAIGAFFEHMPIRPIPGDPTRQHRSIRWGGLAEVFLLDERQHRDPEVPSDSALATSSLNHPEMFDPGRTMLGADQLSWFLSGLRDTPAQWKVVGSQLVFAPFRAQRLPDAAAADPIGQRNAGQYVNMTAWDGYQGERQKVLDLLAAEEIDDTVVLAGDAHFWTTSEIQDDWDDPDAPYVCTEFGGSSVSSANADEMGLPATAALLPVLEAANPQSLRFFDAEGHGIGVMTLTATRATVRYMATATVREPESTVAELAGFTVYAGTNRITLGAVDDDTPVTTTTSTTTAGSGSQTSSQTAQATPRFTG